jgi:hypothetical protein
MSAQEDPGQQRQRDKEAAENAALLALAPRLPEDLKAEFLKIHEGLYCAAHNEGLNCCLDFLVGTWGP